MASDPLNDNGGSGSVAWHFTVNSADIAFLAPGQTLTQDYAVTVADNFGGTAAQNVPMAIHGASPQNLTVNPGATLDIASAFGGSVTFASSTCTLQLDTSTAFTGQAAELEALATNRFAELSLARLRRQHHGDRSAGRSAPAHCAGATPPGIGDTLLGGGLMIWPSPSDQRSPGSVPAEATTAV